jgi:hypothetical protein
MDKKILYTGKVVNNQDTYNKDKRDTNFQSKIKFPNKSINKVSKNLLLKMNIFNHFLFHIQYNNLLNTHLFHNPLQA